MLVIINLDQGVCFLNWWDIKIRKIGMKEFKRNESNNSQTAW